MISEKLNKYGTSLSIKDVADYCCAESNLPVYNFDALKDSFLASIGVGIRCKSADLLHVTAGEKEIVFIEIKSYKNHLHGCERDHSTPLSPFEYITREILHKIHPKIFDSMMIFMGIMGINNLDSHYYIDMFKMDNNSIKIKAVLLLDISYLDYVQFKTASLSYNFPNLSKHFIPKVEIMNCNMFEEVFAN